MAPLPRSIMWGSTARVMRKTLWSVTSMTRSQSSSFMSTTSQVPPRPALLMTTSTWPSVSMAAAASARTCSSDVTSQSAWPTSAPAISESAWAASAVRRSWTSLRKTRAPSSTQRFAAAKPMPAPAAAVISTFLPSRRPWPST